MRRFIFFNGPNPASFLFIFVLFSHRTDKYSTSLTINEKSLDGMLGSRTRGSRMEGADESTELWRHPMRRFIVSFSGAIGSLIENIFS